MYQELGGYVGYRKTPVLELQEMQLSIIAEWEYQAELDRQMKEEQEELQRRMERTQHR